MAWVTAPSVPLYDGVGFPDEPYRYVHPPAGARATRPPSAVSGKVSAAGGLSKRYIQMISAEQGPQVAISASAGAFRGPAKAGAFLLRADPVGAGPATPGYTIDGNIYRLQITSTPAGDVTVTPTGGKVWSEIALRTTTSTPPATPTFLYRTGPSAPWQREHPEQTGNDIFATPLRGPGDYALAFTGDGVPTAPAQPDSPLTIILTGTAIALLICALIGIRIVRSVRRRGAGAQRPADGPGRG